MEKDTNPTYRFGDYVLTPHHHSLVCKGEEIRLRPKVFEVLVFLSEHAGDVVRREELLRAIWPNTNVTESVLDHSISEIREALNDHTKTATWIETIPKIGYRLIAEVERVVAPEPIEARFRMWFGAVALLAFAVGAVIFFWTSLEKGAQLASEPVFLTDDGQIKGWPQLSPDGQHVVFQSQGNLFIKQIAEGTRQRQVTSHLEEETSPVWSPDGTQVTFLRGTDERKAIYTMPAAGGQERKLIDLDPGHGSGWGLSWSPDPDREWLVTPEATEKGASRIVLISPQTGEKRELTNPPEGSPGDADPSFSPDGKQLAFFRSSRPWREDLWIRSVRDGEPRRLTFEEYELVGGLTWTREGREIVFSAGRISFRNLRLYRIPITDGVPEPIGGVGMGASYPCIRGDRMVFLQRQGEGLDIWRISTLESEERAPEPIIRTFPLIEDYQVSVSPDGEKIAFVSSRRGSEQIWMANADGSSEPVQLSRIAGGFPVWSPESRRVAFISTVSGSRNVYVVDVEGGEPKRLGPGGSPGWSLDGRWVYFGIDGRTWKVPFEGGQAIQLTKHGGSRPTPSMDGKYLYYCMSQQSQQQGIWRTPLEGGEEVQILQENILIENWNLKENRLYYGKQERKGDWSIHFLNLDTGETTEVFRVPSWIRGVAPSPDGKWIYYGGYKTLQRKSSDIMLVENFR